jgi:hypothetical protein
MSLFDSVGNQTAKTISDALPGLEKTVSDALSGVQVLVTQTLVPILADIVGQFDAQVNRLDGATITLTPSEKLTVSITVEIPTFTATVSMPLKFEVPAPDAGEKAG